MYVDVPCMGPMAKWCYMQIHWVCMIAVDGYIANLFDAIYHLRER